MNAYFDEIAVPGEGLVYRVVHNFKYAVVQSSFVSVSDIHVGAFSHAFEPFELLYL